MDEPESIQPSSAPPRMHVLSALRRHWGVGVAVIVPVVTIATIVIPLIADATVRQTSAQTLEVDGVAVAEEAPTGSTGEEDASIAQSAASVGLGSVEIVNAEGSGADRDWLVRSDAPFESFPLGRDPGQTSVCSTAQISWLEEWGRRKKTEIWNGYLTLSNVAGGGASMSLRNIRSEGTFTTPPVPEVAVICGGGTGAGSDIIVINQELGSSEPATFGNPYKGLPAGTPAVVNVAPGEFVQMYVNLSRSNDVISDFAGSLVGDVQVGETTTPVVLFDGFTRLGRPEITTTSLRIADRIYCGPDSAFDPCDLPLFISQLQADPGLHR